MRRWGLALVIMLSGTYAFGAAATQQELNEPLGRLLVVTTIEYVVQSGETFESIGARLGVDATAIARRNVKWVHAALPAGTRLQFEAYRTVPPAIDVGLAINIAQRALFVRDRAGSVLALPIAAGRPTWPTPVGEFVVLRKETDPTWDVPVSIQAEMKAEGRTPLISVPPGPQNPLGRFWIGLSLPGIGIHGTNAPSSVPGLTTHGCIRVRPGQIDQLFELVAVGTRGAIVYQPVLLTTVGGRIFLEANRDAYKRHPQPGAELAALAERIGLTDRIDWPRALDVVRRQEGVAVDVTAK